MGHDAPPADAPSRGREAGDAPSRGREAGDAPSRGRNAGDAPSRGRNAGDAPSRGRNAGDAPSRGRNAEATRRRILEAALAEFAEKGIDGARVDRIAERADTNKRMLYHYFGSKDGLYRAVLQQRLADRPAPAADEVGAARRLPRIFTGLTETPQYVRLLTWEALERGNAPEAEAVRRASLHETVAQVAGELAGSGLDEREIALLVLAELALATFPLAFPQVVRLVAGRDATDPAFVEDYAALVGRLGAVIDAGLAAPPGTARPA